MISLALAYLKDRPLTTALNVLLLAIAVAMLVLLVQFGTQANERFERDARGVDLVVGSKGSPLQLILSSVFHVDQPTGNIPLSSLDMLRSDPAVARAVPLALGDNFRGYRIVGTDGSFSDLYGAEISDGRSFEAPMEAVLGASVAAKTGAELGQKFIGSHGFSSEEDGALDHDHAPFETVGILAPTGTVADRLILTSVESVWDVHGIAHDHDHDHDHDHGDEADHENGADHAHDEDEHDHDKDHADKAHHHHEDHEHGDAHDHGEDHAHDHDHEEGVVTDSTPTASFAEVSQDEAGPALQASGSGLEPELTALLVTYRNAAGAIRIPTMINRQTEMQSAVPAAETARLLELVGASLDGVRVFAWLLVVTGGLAIFVALLNMARNREGDLALLRVMGASRVQVFATVIMEGIITAALGAVLGWLSAHGLIMLARASFPTLADLGLEPWRITTTEGFLVLAVLGIGAIAALIPAWRVYRIDPAQTLAWT